MAPRTPGAPDAGIYYPAPEPAAISSNYSVATAVATLADVLGSMLITWSHAVGL